VHAGGRVIGRTVRLAITREVSHSRLAELWDNPVFASPKTDWLTGLTAAFGFWFVVGALGLAAAGALAWWPDGRMSAQVATAVLIIACPCALTLAAPITLGTAMGLLGRSGCYLKRAAVALDLSRVDTVVFDKTGTLTAGTTDASITCRGFDADDWGLVRRLAAESVHPISRALAGRDALPGSASDVREVPGQGLCGTVDGHRVVIGTAAFVAAETGRQIDDAVGRRDRRRDHDAATWAAIDGGLPRSFTFGTPERPGMPDVVNQLAHEQDVWLLSGDHDGERDRWVDLFGRRLRFRQSPDDKLAAILEMRRSGHRVLMVGDGLNDAGALAAAEVGMAVSDDTACLVPACDAVIRGDRLRFLPVFLQYARRARRVIVLCFSVSIAYNGIGLALALAGRLTPLATAVLMPASSLTIVGLSVGLMRHGARKLLPA
jgi:Cu+-exporting ATPase